MPASALYYAGENYNLASSSSSDYGSVFSEKQFDNIGLIYQRNTENYKNGFIVPESGIYHIHVSIMLYDAGMTQDNVIWGYINKNNARIHSSCKVANNYRTLNYEYMLIASAGDLITFTMLQNSGKTIAISSGSRITITRYAA